MAAEGSVDDEILARLTPKPVRRGLAVAMIAALGGILLYLALAAPPAALGWQAFLVAMGAGALALADAVRRATALGLVLTEEALCDTAGRELCRVADIVGVERGPFAFKPSNGFLLRLSAPGPRAWAPGLWWRLGRRIGVGGVTARAEAKFMADLLAARIALRDGDLPGGKP